MTTKRLIKFYNDVGEKYPEEKFVYSTPWGITRKSFILKLLKKFSVPGTFIDIGCGGGVFLKKFYKLGAKTIYGLDISFPALVRAKNNNLANSHFICGDAEKNPFPNDFANTILCSETIEHLENPESFFSEISRIMKKGSVAIITCPNYKGARPFKENIGILQNFGVNGDTYIHSAYTPQELRIMAEKHGLQTIENGTFEKEMRIWGRIWDEIFRFLYKIMNKMKFNSKIITFIYKVHGIIGTIFLWMMTMTGIRYIWRAIFKRGPRSYIILLKNDS